MIFHFKKQGMPGQKIGEQRGGGVGGGGVLELCVASKPGGKT